MFPEHPKKNSRNTYKKSCRYFRRNTSNNVGMLPAISLEMFLRIFQAFLKKISQEFIKQNFSGIPQKIYKKFLRNFHRNSLVVCPRIPWELLQQSLRSFHRNFNRKKLQQFPQYFFFFKYLKIFPRSFSRIFLRISSWHLKKNTQEFLRN